MCWQHFSACDIYALRREREKAIHVLEATWVQPTDLLCLLSELVFDTNGTYRAHQLQKLLRVEIWQQPPIALFLLPTVMIHRHSMIQHSSGRRSVE